MKRTFFARYALLILCFVGFLSPFALRGARMSMQRMTNQVKDWLPSDFAETAELEWFGKYFLGEQFIIVTWPGCGEGDPRYGKLVERLRREVAPPDEVALVEHEGEPVAGAEEAARISFDELTPEQRHALDEQRAGQLGDLLGLHTMGEYFENWGQRREKWLAGDGDLWYFVTPRGELFRSSQRSTMLDWLKRTFRREILRNRVVDGELVATFGEPTPPGQVNAYYADPTRLTARFFKSVTTGPDVLRQLSSKDGALWPRGIDESIAAPEAREKALERLTGTLFGADGQQTCLILTLSEPGKRDLRRVIGRELMGRPLGRLQQIATRECGISADELKLGGPPVDNVAIDEEGQITLARLILLSVAVGVGLSLFVVRSVKLTFMLFIIGGLSAINSLAITWWTGCTVDAIMMSMPSLVYVLAMSGALHLVNYYRESVEEHGEATAPGTMLKLGWKAATLCAVTTSLGLVSLCTSTLVPIRNFGIYSAIGVMATLVLLFTYLPAALQMWPPRRLVHATVRGTEQRLSFAGWLEAKFEALGRFIIRRHAWVLAGCLLVIAVCSLGLLRTETSVHLIKFFDRRAKIIRDYTWLEANLARLVPMELVVRVRPELVRADEAAAPDTVAGDQPPDTQQRLQLSFLERMEIADRIQRVVEQQLGEQGQGVVGRGMSAPTFAPELPPPGYPTLRDPTRAVLSRKLVEHRAEYLASDYLRMETEGPNRGSELWRISLRVGALQDVDYGAFVAELKRVVEPVLTAYRVRDRILSDLDHASGGKGFVKSRVAFLGLQEPSSRDPRGVESRSGAAAEGGAEQAGAGAAEGAEATEESGAMQTRIFAQTLKNLMTCAGALAKAGSWHAPDLPAADGAQAAGGYYTSAAWGEILAKKFDCVVLVQDHPAYDVEFIQQHAAVFIDARDHGYEPDARDARTAAQRDAPIHVVYTGVVPLVYKAQRSLLDSLIQSTFWSFITITPLMMILARNAVAGIVVMLPNVLPVVIVFGGMGLLKIDVDVGSMMTASIALGVAVDDTIHFLTWYREDLDRLGDRHLALLAAYRRCAVPTMQAAVISGLGLSVFALSTFTPTQRFGALMLTILFAGVVAELIMLPALLAGPLGKFCGPRGKRRAAQGDDSTASGERQRGELSGPARDSSGVTAGPAPHLKISKRMRAGAWNVFRRRDAGTSPDNRSGGGC